METKEVDLKKKTMNKGKIGNAVSYAPASNNVVSTDIPKTKMGKVGPTKDEWMEQIKTTNWWYIQHG